MVGIAVPKAVLINADDFGFGVFINDDKSSRFYEENLNLVPT